jgi:GxxExxY protein
MYQDSELTERIICSAYNVHNLLGSGFLEKVYENALSIELKGCGLSVDQQRPMQVFYKGLSVGEYFADLIVEERVVIELKAVEQLSPIHEIQLKNYLKATGIEVGLLVNFGSSVEIRRKHVKNV